VVEKVAHFVILNLVKDIVVAVARLQPSDDYLQASGLVWSFFY
jgi:hypothetical protein